MFPSGAMISVLVDIAKTSTMFKIFEAESVNVTVESPIKTLVSTAAGETKESIGSPTLLVAVIVISERTVVIPLFALIAKLASEFSTEASGEMTIPASPEAKEPDPISVPLEFLSVYGVSTTSIVCGFVAGTLVVDNVVKLLFLTVIVEFATVYVSGAATVAIISSSVFLIITSPPVEVMLTVVPEAAVV